MGRLQIKLKKTEAERALVSFLSNAIPAPMMKDAQRHIYAMKKEILKEYTEALEKIIDNATREAI